MLVEHEPFRSTSLADRVSALDAELRMAQEESVEEWGRLAAAFLSDVSNCGTPIAEVPVMRAEAADAQVASSHMVRELESSAPWLWHPWDSTTCWQERIVTGRMPGKVPPERVLSAAAFIPPSSLIEDDLARYPVPAGLFTATSCAASGSMWRMYLQGNSNGPLWGKPWDTWRVDPADGVSIAEISTARDWVSLVERFPNPCARGLRPHWVEVAQAHDALHITPSAALAIDGIAFKTEYGDTVPIYWSCESTFWLRWSFKTVTLLGSTLDTSATG